MTHETDQTAQAWLDDIRATLQRVTEADGDESYSIKLETTPTFGGNGIAVQLYCKLAWGVGRNPWRKVGPLLFPPKGAPWSDMLRMLADLAEGVA